MPLGPKFGLDEALREALRQWLKLIDAGPPRSIDRQMSKTADVIIFTDGFTPDPREAVRPRLPEAVL